MIFELLAWGDDVGVGASSPRFCTLGGIAKFGAAATAYTAANEHVCATIGAFIGLPVPPSVLIRAGDRVGSVSLRFGKHSELPPMINVEHFTSDLPELTARIVAFDVWIHNTDRHDANLSYSRAGKIPPAVFDHDQALLWVFADRGVIHLAQNRDSPLTSHILAASIRDESWLLQAYDRINQVPDFVISDACARCVNAGAITDAEATAVVQFLAHRRSSLQSLVEPLLGSIQRAFS